MRPHTDDVRRTQGLELRMRVGLNSGEVVVRAIGNDLHMDYSAVGETTVLAARMEQTATPGSVRLTPATLRLVEGLVQVNALGPVPVKGLVEPVEVFELLGASGVRRRLQAAAARGLTHFVGRDQELVVMQQALEQASAGYGQVVALVGEAGVGKSRLVYECVHSHRTQSWRVLESASVSYGKATPYFPVIDLLRRYGRVDDGDDLRTMRAKITGQVLTLDAALQDTVPALLALLDARPDDSPFLQLDPLQRRQRTLAALKRVLLRESQVQPLLLVFEDLHWIDTETQALLDSLVESLPTAQLLLLVNYRPEYQHGWGSKTYYTQLRLDPLPPVSADAFLQTLLGGDPSLATLKQLLIERTGGNPFFLEESVRTLLETEVLVGEPGAYRLVQALPTVQVPATVHAVLAARIDRLPAEEKYLLQTAAVIGTEVPLTLLQGIAELPEAALHRGLAHLQAAEFLYETRLFPDHAYTFKHALTHEVAYGSLLQERRRGVHARIVALLERLAPDRLAEQVEHLAYHALRGEVWEKALTYCRQAGIRAVAHSAYREAVTYFEQALGVLEHLPASRALREQAIDLRFHLHRAYLPLLELTQVLNHLHEAETLAEALGDRWRLCRIAALLTQYRSVIGDHDRALASGQRAVAIARALDDVTLQVEAHQLLGVTYHVLGDYQRAIASFGRNVASITGEALRERFNLGGIAAVQCRAWLVWGLAEQGRFAEGRPHCAEAMRIAEAADHRVTLLHAQFGSGVAALRQGNLLQAIPLLERGFSISQAWHPAFFPRFAGALGAAYALAGQIAEALPLLVQAVAHDATAQLLTALWRTHLGEAYVAVGRLGEATLCAEQALEYACTHHERGHEAYALRLLGAIAAQREPPESEPAEAHYQQALDLAEALGMRPLVAHCHLGLGRLYSQTGCGEQAHAALTAAIDLYRAMDMTFWLPQAEAALAQME